MVEIESKHIRCSSFTESGFKIGDTFVINQEELFFIDDSVSTKSVSYFCSFKRKKSKVRRKYLALIPVRNNSELLKFTLSNLFSNNFLKYSDLMLIDDRSEEDIYSIVKEYNISYLKINNDKGFNFSMLNNIGALIAKEMGYEWIMLWNSDLWISKENFLEKFINKHQSEKAVITGSKLLYPIESFTSGASNNIKFHFSEWRKRKYRGTVQFGGSKWIRTRKGAIPLSPDHFGRFFNHKDKMVNCDKEEIFVTGALMIVNLNWFFNEGGLNPSLSKVFQDVDLCLRAKEKNQQIMYYGKDIHFFHDESLTFFSDNKNKKSDEQYYSDHLLFAKLWNKKIPLLVPKIKRTNKIIEKVKKICTHKKS